MSTPKIGDFVRIKLKQWGSKYKNLSPCDDNVFEIENISAGNYKLDEFNELIPASFVEPIPIDRHSAGNIYYDPIIAASFIGPSELPPIHKTDYRYFMDSFLDSSYEGGRSMYDIVISRKYKYVHEVQQWLRRDYGWEELRINHKYKKIPDICALRLWEQKDIFKENGVPEHLFLYEICNILYIKYVSEKKIRNLEFPWNELTMIDTPLPAYSEDISKFGQYAYINSNGVLNGIIKYIDGIGIDVFGDILESLIEKALSEPNSNLRQYATNSKVMETIIKVLGPKSGEYWDDPAAGIGGTFIEINRYQKGHIQKSNLSGCEINNTYAWIGQCNLLFHNIPCQLEHKDYFDRNLRKYDGIVCDIPLGNLKINPPKALSLKVGNRMLNFILQICASLKDKDTSRAGFVVPDGFFNSSMKEYVLVKKYLFSNFGIKAILKLPEGLSGLGIKQSVIFISKQKKSDSDIWVYNARERDSIGHVDNEDYTYLNRFPKDLLYFDSHKEVNERNEQWMRIGLSDIISKDYCFSIDEVKGFLHESLKPATDYLKEAVKISKQLTVHLQELYSMFDDNDKGTIN